MKANITLDWLIGFVEGEGSFFCVRRQLITPSFSISQTDRTILEEIRNFLGFGIISEHKRVKPEYEIAWNFTVNKTEDLARLVSMFDGRLRSEKKRLQFEQWKDIVLQRKAENRCRDYWTAEENVIGKQLTLARKTCKEVSQILNRSPGAINNHNHRIWHIPKHKNMKVTEAVE